MQLRHVISGTKAKVLTADLVLREINSLFVFLCLLMTRLSNIGLFKLNRFILEVSTARN